MLLPTPTPTETVTVLDFEDHADQWYEERLALFLEAGLKIEVVRRSSTDVL